MNAGRYRVVLNGYKVQNESWDHPLELDGKRDEVFVATKVMVMDAAGNLIVQSERASKVMGDTNNQPGRVRAGTASDQGGLKTGDSFPKEAPWIRTTEPSLERDYPTVTLWEGDLVQGEHVVLIASSIWEDDDSGPILNDWLTWAGGIYSKVKPQAQVLAGADPTAQAILLCTEIGLGIAVSAVESGVIGANGDRPIGMVANGSGKYVFDQKLVRLTYDIAEYQLRSDFGMGPGVFGLEYKDDVKLQGHYYLYLQVERVGEVQVQPHRAAFVAQSVPTSVRSGASFDAEVRMRNTGTEVWVPDGATPYRLGSQNPQDNTSWGTGRVGLTAPVAPGEEATFRFTAKAPVMPGRHNFQWRMVHEMVTWFGEFSPNLAIDVQADPFYGVNGAQVVSVQVPSTVMLGEVLTVAITLRNTGTRTWSPTGSNSHRLGSQNPQDNSAWGQSRIDLPSAVAPGQEVTIRTELGTPIRIGTYNFQWRMVQEGVEWFGDPTPNQSITVRRIRLTKPIGELEPSANRSLDGPRAPWGLVEDVSPGHAQGHRLHGTFSP
jgi:hypothetical protein